MAEKWCDRYQCFCLSVKKILSDEKIQKDSVYSCAFCDSNEKIN